MNAVNSKAAKIAKAAKITEVGAALTGRGQRVLERWPEAYIRVLRRRHRGQPFLDRVIGPDTQIVIEGYPRSGNSFANRAFALSQPDDVRIATHTHAAAQIQVAARRGVPALVVVRDPAAAIPSLYALREQVRRSHPQRRAVDIAEELARYTRFHDRLDGVTDEVVVALFDEVTSDYGAVIDRVNRRFGSEFVTFDHTEANVAQVFASSGDHLSPSEARESDKQRGIQLYADAPKELREAADASYRRVVSVAENQRETF